MKYYGVFRHFMDGTEKMVARSKSETNAHDYAERMNEDWDDPEGSWFDYRLVEDNT
jgi:hypothetical protein